MCKTIKSGFSVAVVKELSMCVVITGLLCGLLIQYSKFELDSGVAHQWRIASLFIATTPALVFYLLLRTTLARGASALVILGAGALLLMSHATKYSVTGAPLSWGDLASRENFHVAVVYAPWMKIIAAAIIVCSLLTYLAKRSALMVRPNAVATSCKLVCCFCLSLVAFYPYLPDRPFHLQQRLSRLLQRLDIHYISWDWPANVVRNGLFLHLVQTSRRVILPALSSGELTEAKKLKATGPLALGPQHIFFILCESCWHGNQHFDRLFEPLKREGFVSFRAISPTYGGGTVNSAFEMITALPSRGALTGIIYQEYAELIKDTAMTIASSLSEKGYRTYALHNFERKFWKRSVVMNKLGFNQFVGIEDMHYDGPIWLPRDSVLFDHALEILKGDAGKPAFYHLETVYGHGPYEAGTDHGRTDYERKIGATIADIAAFVAAVRRTHKDSVFVVYGDHKPSLNRYFYEHGILRKEAFATIGEQNGDFTLSYDADPEALGDVPVLIGGLDNVKLDTLAELLNGKPLYCVSAVIDKLVLHSGNPSSEYSYEHLCTRYREGRYFEAASEMPSWMYSASLFDDQVSW